VLSCRWLDEDIQMVPDRCAGAVFVALDHDLVHDCQSVSTYSKWNINLPQLGHKKGGTTLEGATDENLLPSCEISMNKQMHGPLANVTFDSNLLWMFFHALENILTIMPM
jgi:hypothetical protein